MRMKVLAAALMVGLGLLILAPPPVFAHEIDHGW